MPRQANKKIQLTENRNLPKTMRHCSKERAEQIRLTRSCPILNNLANDKKSNTMPCLTDRGPKASIADSSEMVSLGYVA